MAFVGVLQEYQTWLNAKNVREVYKAIAMLSWYHKKNSCTERRSVSLDSVFTYDYYIMISPFSSLVYT